MSGIIAALCVIAVLACAGIGAYFVVRSKVRRFSQAAFGTSDIMKGIEQERLEFEQTPKSLSSMETMVAPKIAADFPELNLNEMKNRASADIVAVLTAIEQQDIKSFEKSPKVNAYVIQQIEDGRNGAHFDSIKLHGTVLNRYIKSREAVTMRFQCAVEYLYSEKATAARKVQDRYELDYTYGLDAEKLANGVSAYLKCPNCGAPVKTVGVKFCEYCGTGIIAKIEKVWEFDAVRQA